MPFIQMQYGMPYAEGVQYFTSSYSKDYFLTQPLFNISCIKMRGYLSTSRVIHLNVRIH